ncbi:hypothetical protein [Aquimarina sp. 2201CG5-10]|uniref:hypothetical protein n=1 Tax=Aquimarina callyspongiae TaxID=3098150 RepID=UPI002AC996D2|nr:hypothetical protein [Aquimarina sp. 2201CG5-10]
MKSRLSFQVNYKNGFIILAVIVGFLMPFLSVDYSQTEDQRFHQEHGKRLLDYYKGISDVSLYSPLDDQGNFVDVVQSVENEHRGMNIFGGFFDLLSNFLHQFFPSSGIYEFRNIISSLFGLLLFVFCGLIGKEIGGWRAGIISFISIVLTPYLFGQAMTNPKDIPFAAFYIFSVFHIIKLLKELPKITLKRVGLLAFNFSLLINVRLLGLVVLPLFFCVTFIWWLLKHHEEKYKNIVTKNTLFFGLKILGIGALSYFSVFIFWPYIQTKPLTGVVELFVKLKDFKGFTSIQLFEGQWGNSHDVPWYYMIKSLLFLVIPIHVLIGYFLIPIYYVEKSKKEILLFSFVLFSGLIPLGLIVLGEPNSYDNGRHFMFILPPIITSVAVSYNGILNKITNKKHLIAAYVGIMLFLLEPLFFTLRNHQLQSLYFTPVIGGVKGAFKNYEIDYWGVGIKPAIEWLENNVGSIETPARVRLFYGEQLKLKYYAENIPNLDYVVAHKESKNWDYSVVMLSEAKLYKSLLDNWPPENTVYEVKVDDLAICVVTKNNYKIDEVLLLENQLKTLPSADGYVQLSLLHFNKANYFKTIEASLKAIQLDPLNVVAYNNLGVSYNMLLMYSKAKVVLEKALEINPNFQLAINNLNVSKEGVQKREGQLLTEKEYLTLSYNYFQNKDFLSCIKASEELLLKNPGSVSAYNNICSSYNNLGEWEKAIKACEKALQINQNFDLAKNNLKWAQEKLKK